MIFLSICNVHVSFTEIVADKTIYMKAGMRVTHVTLDSWILLNNIDFQFLVLFLANGIIIKY